MDYKSQIKEIVEVIKPDFAILGAYAFQGNGAPPVITSSFIRVFENYQKAKALIAEFYGTDTVELREGSTNCEPDGGSVYTNDNQMLMVYTIAKEQGFLPPPMLEMIKEFTFQMNQFFIAAQQKA